MIFIVVKFDVKPDWAERWANHVAEFTTAAPAEEGNLRFEWSRSLEDPSVYVLVETFRDNDNDAGAAHVNSDHFKKAVEVLPLALASTPKIVSQTAEGTGWSRMGEMKVWYKPGLRATHCRRCPAGNTTIRSSTKGLVHRNQPAAPSPTLHVNCTDLQELASVRQPAMRTIVSRSTGSVSAWRDNSPVTLRLAFNR